MYAALPNKLGDMPPPSTNPEAWLALMAKRPVEWKALVSLIKFHDSAVDTKAKTYTLPVSLHAHTCTLCVAPFPMFPTKKGLCQHMRVVHGIRNHYKIMWMILDAVQSVVLYYTRESAS